MDHSRKAIGKGGARGELAGDGYNSVAVVAVERDGQFLLEGVSIVHGPQLLNVKTNHEPISFQYETVPCQLAGFIFPAISATGQRVEVACGIVEGA